jgi:predicted transcriptional regulator
MNNRDENENGDKDVHLSDVQMAVMRTLWAEGNATTATVHERAGKPRSLAYTTIATVLARLEKRGLLRSVKDGRERVFAPLVSEGQVRKQMVADLLSTLFRGDPRALVSHLVSESGIDEGDLDAIRTMLEESKSDE